MGDNGDQPTKPTTPVPPTQQEEEEGEEQEVLEGTVPVDLSDFFPEVDEDFSEVIWGHRVNSQADLEAALQDPKVMMLEADILRGHLKVKDEGNKEEVTTAIMAHPPDTTSDLSFTMWIDQVIAANQEGQKKGVKLDFKDISVVKECLEELVKKKDKITFPVWLNADILPGPIDSPATPLPANEFLSLCAEHLPQATLSLGWTTHVPPSSTGAVTAGYGKQDVERMVEVLEENSITQPVTFPIRAALIPHSLEALEWLLDTVPDSSLTIWSSPQDPFDPMAIVTLRDLLGTDAVFVDLPDTQMTQYRKAMAGGATTGGATGGEARPTSYFTSASTWGLVGMALASALASLYLYE